MYVCVYVCMLRFVIVWYAFLSNVMFCMYVFMYVCMYAMYAMYECNVCMFVCSYVCMYVCNYVMYVCNVM